MSTLEVTVAAFEIKHTEKQQLSGNQFNGNLYQLARSAVDLQKHTAGRPTFLLG
jgi:hypothetical protein